MRGAAIAFVIEHWRFFLGFIVFGVTAALILSGIRRIGAAQRAKEDAIRDKALEAELAEIRKNQGGSGG